MVVQPVLDSAHHVSGRNLVQSQTTVCQHAEHSPTERAAAPGLEAATQHQSLQRTASHD